MITKLKSTGSFIKSFIIAGCVLALACSGLNAWTIKCLSPAAVESGYDLPIGSSIATFKGYLTATGATLTTGSLASGYAGADAVIVNLIGLRKTYSTAEINVLTALFNSNVPTLVFGEHVTFNVWLLSNQQLATIVNGTASSVNGADNQTITNASQCPILTTGVSSVTFLDPGVITPKSGSTGVSLTNGNAITLWGTNKNFLLFLDVNALGNGSDGKISSNTKLAQNIATFLTTAIVVPPTISAFTGTNTNPTAPIASISATPQSGPAPLTSTVEWSSTNAGSVSVSGPNLESDTAEGNQTLTDLAQGSYTYTITANPTAATLSWTTSGADSLTLVTPDGNVTVTGLTSYPATVSGTYTLQATNTKGMVTSPPVTVTIPDAATESVTITVEAALPTIPASIDPDTFVVIPDPTTPGGIVIDGEIDADPQNPDHSKIFEATKMTVVTTTDILGTWTIAPKTGYSLNVAGDGKSFTLAINPTADAARFYRVVTTLQAVDATGAPVADAAVLYNTTIAGTYKVTVPGKQRRFIVNQLSEGITDAVALFKNLKTAGSSLAVSSPSGGTSQSAMFMGVAWMPATLSYPVGSIVNVYNAGTTAVTVSFTGKVPTTTMNINLQSGVTKLAGSLFPLSKPIHTLGLTVANFDTYATYNSTGALTNNLCSSAAMNLWSAGVPTPAIGEGFQLKHMKTEAWTGRLDVKDTTTTIQLVK